MSVAAACRDVADYARGLVGAIDQDQEVRGRVRALRQLRLHALTALDRGVLACKVAGASWAELGDALGLPASEVERRYADMLARWEARAPVDHQLLIGEHATGLPYDADPRGTALALDAWYARHCEPWEVEDGADGPVTRALSAHA